jgi:uncharacterized membrane protein YkvA (DUF1232 family)
MFLIKNMREKMTIKFYLADLEINGEWDENSRLLLLENLGGTISLTGRVMGWKFNGRALIETGLNNLIHLRLDEITGIPRFLIPWVLKLSIKFNKTSSKREALIVRKDTILIDPNLLFAESFNGRVLIQPKNGVENDSENVVPKLRDRILNWVKEHGGELAGDITEMVLVVPDLVVLLIKLMKDDRIPVDLKLKITLAVAYVVSPLDLIPEALGNVLGFVDDTLAMAILITGLVEEIPDEIIYDNWNGRPDILELVLKGKNLLLKMLPVNITEKLNSLFSISQKESAVAIDQNNVK